MAKAPRNTAPKSAFAQAAAGHAAAFNEARQAERQLGGGFVLPEIEDGEYIAQVDVVELGVNPPTAKPENAGKPFVNIKVAVVEHPEYQGTPLNKWTTIKATQKSTLAQCWNRVLNDLYGLGYEVTEGTTLEEIESIAAHATENKPLVYVRVKNGEYNKQRTLNTDFLGAVPEEAQEYQEPEEEDEGEEDEGEEPEAEQEAPAPPPRKAAAKAAPPKAAKKSAKR